MILLRLSDHITHCKPLDDCWRCRTYQQFLASDVAQENADEQAYHEHHQMLRMLKAWSRSLCEPFRSQLKTQIATLEREWPMPHPRRRLDKWPGWTNSSRK